MINYTFEYGYILTFAGVIISAAFGMWQYRKTRFSDSVIKSRKEYLKAFREESARFCISTERIINGREFEDVRTQLDSAYKLKLMLNPFDYVDWWDGEIIKIIDELVLTPTTNRLQQLLALLQASCIVEWKGITIEGISGIQGKRSKEKLRNEVYDKYVVYCKNRNIYG